MTSKILFRSFLITFTIAFQLLTGKQLHAQQKFYYIDKFATAGGDTINNCKIGYRTLGKLNSDSSNVIIYPTWFGGTSGHLKSLIKPERFVDTTRYFVIAIDALGNGVSSSPSNYAGAKSFPVITISDMVRSQFILLSSHFGLKGIYGAIGGSMGGMQVFEWVCAYPSFIEKAVIYVSTPEPTTNDLLQWNLRLNVIETYESLNASEKQISKTLKMISDLTARSPDYLNEKISFEDFDLHLEKYDSEPNKIFTAANNKCQIEAMLSHSIYTDDRIKTLPWNSTEIMFIVSDTDRLVHPHNTIEFAEKYGYELHVLKNNCGHLAIGCEIERCSELIRSFFK